MRPDAPNRIIGLPGSREFVPIVGKSGPPKNAINGTREEARQLFSELAAKFPTADSLYGGFDVTSDLIIPAGIAVTVPAGNAAGAYTLIEIDPAERGMDIVLFGLWFDALSCNPNPTNAGAEAAWGDQFGYGAGLVVGKDLPSQGPGAWCAWKDAGIVGIDTSPVINRGGRFTRTFPTGKYTTGFNKRGMNGAIVPFVRRIPQNSRLGAAFVLNRAQLVAGAGKTILGGLEVEIYFGLTKTIEDQRA